MYTLSFICLLHLCLKLNLKLHIELPICWCRDLRGVCVATHTWLILPAWDDGWPVDDGDFSPRLMRVQRSPKVTPTKKKCSQATAAQVWYLVWRHSGEPREVKFGVILVLSALSLSLLDISYFFWSYDDQRNKQNCCHSILVMPLTHHKSLSCLPGPPALTVCVHACRNFCWPGLLLDSSIPTHYRAS